MAGVGELVASAVVKELVKKLGSWLGSEIGLLWSFKDDLKDMKSTLETIGAVLNDAEKKSFKERLVRLWLKKLKDAAYDIEDMLDELPTQNLLLYSPIMAHKLKGMRKRLDKIAQERSSYNLIKEEAISYEKQVIEERKTSSVVFKDDVFGRDQEATQIINRLLVSTTTNESTALSVIPIVGIGGLGKTTLAKLIYDDDRIKEVFKPRIWVHAVNLEVEKLVEAILSSLEAENRNTLSNFNAKMTRAKEILQGKRYLIVLDDVWNEDWQKWEAFKQILQCGGKRESKIIVTTRSDGVPSIMGAETTHILQPLSDDNCLKLFMQRAFRSADAIDNHLASIGEEIVKKCRGVPLAANALGGMLHSEKWEAAWKKVRDSDLWELKEEEGGSSSENKIISSLKLSYQHMPSALKLCFVYCSSYPRAFKLNKNMLIQQWIAQRFIQTEDEVEALQIGDGYVNYLLSMSFLEEDIGWFRDEDANTYMKMHDLVYDLARWVAGNEVSVLDALESRKDNVMECRYASLIEYNGPSKELGKALPLKVKVRALHFQEFTSLPKGIFSYTKYLRVLDFTNCSFDELPTSIYKLKQLRYLRLPDHLEEVDERIGKLGSLERLVLSNNSAIHTLPTSIGKLHNLIYLEIYARKLSEIPYSIGSLQKLNNLKLVGCNMLRSLPESLGNLVKLATLTINNCKALTSLPESLGNLVKLETLDIRKCYELERLSESLGNLVKLETLDIRKCYELERLSESLGNLVKLETLIIYNCRAIRSIPESLSNLVNLKTLAIGKFWGFTLPVSIGKLHNLIDLDLSFSDKLMELPDSIGELQKLNSLKLNGCHNLGSLPESLGNLMELRTLDIQRCAMLDQYELPQAICNMRHLKIQRDEPQELREFDTSVLHLHLVHGDPEHVVRDVTNAKRINLKERDGSIKSLSYHCGHKKGRLVEAMLEELQPHQNLQELQFYEYGGSMFPSWMRSQMVSFLPNLVKIKLTRINNCEHLPVLGKLPKLEEIIIDGMWKVRRISEEEFCGARNTTAGASFPSLKRLELSGMTALEEWVTAAMAGDDGERGASLFPCLEHLTIENCHKLRRIHPCIPPSVKRLVLQSMNKLEELVTAAMAGDNGEQGASLFPCLEDLTISNCSNLRRIHPCIPPSVKRLELWNMDELEEWVTAAMAGDDGERGASLFPGLENLTISNCYKLRKIHPCILPSVKRLKLSRMWELEEWVTAAMAGDDGERGASLFPCLEDLTISNCYKLRRIHPCIPPSVKRLVLQSMNMLEELVTVAMAGDDGERGASLFPCLEDLTIENCSELQRIHPCIPPSVNRLVLQSMNKLEELVTATMAGDDGERGVSLFPCLEDLTISKCSNLRRIYPCIPPSVKRLELQSMNKLEELVTAAMAGDDGERGASLFPCLEDLTIVYCPKLRRIHPCILPSVKRLKLSRMWELEELVTAAMARDDGERGASIFPCLEDLTIENCHKLRRIHPCIPPSVKRLVLQSMNKLEELVTAAMAGDDGERGASLFPCLEDLTIKHCPKLRRIHPCIPPSVRRLSLSFIHLHILTFLDVPEMPLLKHLHIRNVCGLDSFPESIRRLTSLETLKLEDFFRLATLPDWLGELSQLQHLEIYHCPLIDRLPQSIQHLTALKRLGITRCSESLLERTRKETGEDRDKISHIDNIQITTD